MLFGPIEQSLFNGVALVGMPSMKLTGALKQRFEVRVRPAFAKELMHGLDLPRFHGQFRDS
jgi:hypothetical protein